MKRNTLFGAAGLLVAGAAIGAGAIVSQNAMASDGQVETANALTMINISDDGTAVQCTFTGADAEGLVPEGIPTDDALKAQMVMGVANIVPADGSLPVIDVDGGTVVGSTGIISGEFVTSGSLPVGAVEASGVITVGASTSDGKVEITGVGPDGAPIAGSDAREGTAEECAAMRDQALADLANLKTQVAAATNGEAVINVSGEAGVTTEP